MASIRKNVAANYIGQAWTVLMGLAFLPFYVQVLGLEAYGLIGVYSAFQGSLAILDNGLTATMSREAARHYAGAREKLPITDLLRTFEIIILIVAIAIALCTYFLADLIATDWLNTKSLPSENVVHAVRLMGLVAALRFCENIYRGTLLGLQRQVAYNGVSTICATLRWAGAAAVLLYGFPTIEAFFAWQAVVSIVTVLALASLAYKSLPAAQSIPRFSFDELRRVKSFAFGMMATSISAVVLTQADKIAIARLLPLSDLGSYTLAGSVAASLGILAYPISQAYCPRLTELATAGNEKALSLSYHQMAQLLVLIIVPAGATFVLFSSEILALWSDNSGLVEATSLLASLLVAGTILNALMGGPYALSIGVGWASYAAKLNSCAAVALIACLCIAVPLYGSLAAAVCWVGLNALYVTVGVFFLHRRILRAEAWQWMWIDTFRPLAAAFGAASLARWLFDVTADRSFTSFAHVVVGATLTAAATIAATPLSREFIQKVLIRRSSAKAEAV